MISSMTGYGRGSASIDGREMTVELKSVNHRYLDLGMRLPRHIGFLRMCSVRNYPQSSAAGMSIFL